jgi:aromatic ring-opening dioxygenase catalytic subunit (LigB family)
VTRLPTTFLPHGGGPWPFVDLGVPAAEVRSLKGFLSGLLASLPARPRAILVVTAHWEAAVPTVSTGAAPGLLYDYYGFPPAAYALSWPAPGSPEVAAEVVAALAAAGLPIATDAARGFDHGTFVPMMLVQPGGELPVVQLSLIAGLDAEAHIALGRALAPLRDAGIWIVGSGMTFHNLRTFFDPRSAAPATAFDAWLVEAMQTDAPARAEALTNWTSAPHARFVHPREEHLLPLHVVVGAGGDDPGRVAWRGTYLGLALSAFHVG